MADQDQRIAELEMRLVHQDKTLADLNEMVLAQWRKIEALERQLNRMTEDIQDVSASAVPVDKPPHY